MITLEPVIDEKVDSLPCQDILRNPRSHDEGCQYPHWSGVPTSDTQPTNLSALAGVPVARTHGMPV